MAKTNPQCRLENGGLVLGLWWCGVGVGVAGEGGGRAPGWGLGVAAKGGGKDEGGHRPGRFLVELIQHGLRLSLS